MLHTVEKLRKTWTKKCPWPRRAILHLHKIPDQNADQWSMHWSVWHDDFRGQFYGSALRDESPMLHVLNVFSSPQTQCIHLYYWCLILHLYMPVGNNVLTLPSQHLQIPCLRLLQLSFLHHHSNAWINIWALRKFPESQRTWMCFNLSKLNLPENSLSCLLPLQLIVKLGFIWESPLSSIYLMEIDSLRKGSP